jgi:hypothetical protein
LRHTFAKYGANNGMSLNLKNLVRSQVGKTVTCAIACIFIVTSAWAQAAAKDTKPAKPEKVTPLTNLKIIVTGGDKDAPVSNASVYIRYEEPRFLRSAEKIELDLKTSQEGIAKVKDVPRIRVMIQVVKDGWKPFGEYYLLTKDEQTVEIKLQAPPHWY